MKLEKLTPEQETKMLEVKNFWLNYINSCKNNIDRPRATNAINLLYKSVGRENPIVIYVDSPMSCQYAVYYIKALFSKLPEAIKSAQVWGQVRDQVRDQVWAQVGAQVGDQVRDQVWGQVWAQVGGQKINFEGFASYGNIGDYGWVSFFDFFTQIGVINHKGFNDFKEVISSGIYDMIQLNGFCIVSDLPKTLSRNQLQQLHNLDSPAVSFSDGYNQHYINGRFIPEKYFNSISNKIFKIEDFINETNEEYKSTCIAFIQEKYGDEYLVDFFRKYLTEVDTYVNKKDDKYMQGTTKGMNVGVYTLFKGNINNENIAYVRCYCPSTDRMFFLGVDSEYSTAKDAIASLYRIPKKLKSHIKSISRQGERYSTILTEDGNNILKVLKKNEIEDVSGIDGELYFELMQYEY